MNHPSRGIWHALAAYVLWGLLPVYWKALRSLAAPEILAHRIVWSFLFLLLVLTMRREWPALQTILTNRRSSALYAIASALLAINWLTYIHGVNTGRIVETSLGYFINPLVSVILGTAFLHERLRRGQWLAIGLAATGVAFLAFRSGKPPWIALVLATSFGLYGLAKKKAPAAAVPGLAFETGALFLPAVAYLGMLAGQGEGALGNARLPMEALLVLSGVVTALPLLLFAHAAREVSLATIGLLIGVLVYRENFEPARQLGFGLIWLGLAFYWLEGVWRGRDSVRLRDLEARALSGK